MMGLALVSTAIAAVSVGPLIPDAVRFLASALAGVDRPRRAAFLSGLAGGFFGGIATGSSLGICIGVAAGALWPALCARRRAERTERAIVRRFPDFLDLLALALSAGATLEIALSTALEAEPIGPLRLEMNRLLDDIRRGTPCAGAFAAEAERRPDLRHAAVFRFLAESAQSGHDAASWLTTEAQSQRDRWFLSLETRARTASLRLLVPTILLLFPTTFVLLLAPLYLRYRMGGLPF